MSSVGIEDAVAHGWHSGPTDKCGMDHFTISPACISVPLAIVFDQLKVYYLLGSGVGIFERIVAKCARAAFTSMSLEWVTSL